MSWRNQENNISEKQQAKLQNINVSKTNDEAGLSLHKFSESSYAGD